MKTRVTRAVLFAGFITAALTVAPQPANAADPILSLKNYATQRCLDSNSAGQVYALTCNGGSNQNWAVRSTSSGLFVFVNRATGRCLDSNNAGHIYTLACNGGNNQKWDVVGADHRLQATVLQNWATKQTLDSNSSGAVYGLTLSRGANQWWTNIER